MCPSRKTRASAQFEELLAILGVHSPLSKRRGLHGPRAALSAPLCAASAPVTGNSPARLVPRLGTPGARGPRVPLAAAYLRLRSARRAAPSPNAQTGCERPRVDPCPFGSVPRDRGAGGSGTGRSEARKETRADPLPPRQKRAGGGPPPPPRSSRPSLPQRRAEIAPSPRGSDLGTGRGFAPGPSPAFPPGSRSRTPNKVPRPPPGAGRAAVAVLGEGWRAEGTPPVGAPGRAAGGRPGSAPGHSLPEPSPFGSPGSARATTPRPPLHPSLSRGVILGRSCAFSQDPETLSFHSQTPGAIHSSSRGNPET